MISRFSRKNCVLGDLGTEFPIGTYILELVIQYIIHYIQNKITRSNENYKLSQFTPTGYGNKV